MVLPALAIPIMVGVGSSLVTGIATYYMTRPNQPGHVTDSKGEIYNNVHLAVKENNTQNSMLVLLISILVFIKFFEMTVFMVNKIRRRYRKRYQLRFEQQLATIQTPPQLQQAAPAGQPPV